MESEELIERMENHQENCNTKVRKIRSSQLWETVADRVNKLSLKLSKLVQVVPAVKELLEQEGLKTAYELNKIGIRDDQAPIGS